MNRTVESRQTVMSFGRGLYVLRYASGDNLQAPPRVRFSVASGTASVRVIPQPGASAGELRTVGDLTVISADGPGTLDVRLEESRPGGGFGCSLALDRLGGKEPLASPELSPSASFAEPRTAQSFTPQSFARPLVAPSPPAQAFVAPPQPTGPEVVAHLSHRGDVAFKLGEWIGGPSAPTPIEGFGVAAAQAREAGLEVQVMTVGSDRWSEASRAGTLAGSRGQGRPLRALRLQVPASSPYSLRADVLFLGATIAEKAGRTLEFISSSPFDALVGLRIEFVREAARDVAPSTLSAPAVPANRLKVFRSSRAS